MNDLSAEQIAELKQTYRDSTNTNGNGHHEPSRLRSFFKTAKILMSEAPREIGWIMRPVMAQGSVTLLAGTPKYGKTEYALAMASAIVHGSAFCGHYPASRGPVVYLSEMDPATLNPYLMRHHLDDSEQLHIITFATMVAEGISWVDVVAGAVETALEVGAHAIIVDTFSRIANLIGETENSSGAIMEAMRPLYVAKASGLGIMLSHHTGKAGEGIDAIRGSSAIAGEADHIIMVKKPEGGFSDQRVRIVEYLGRLGVNETRSIRLHEEGYYEDLGIGVRRKIDEVEQHILDAIPIYESSAKDKSALEIELDEPEITIRRALKKLVEDDLIMQKGRGKPSDPYVYWKAPTEVDHGVSRKLPVNGVNPLLEGVVDRHELCSVDTDRIMVSNYEPPGDTTDRGYVNDLPAACSAPDLCARMGPCTHAPHCPDVKSR